MEVPIDYWKIHIFRFKFDASSIKSWYEKSTLYELTCILKN